jgi:hypothetical protein
VAFFEGGLDYHKAMLTPLPELWDLQVKASKIADRRKKATPT